MATSPLPPLSRSLSTAELLYRIFLRLYPKGFRQGYEQEMTQTFRDCCREALQRSGMPGLLRFCGYILGELLITACKERLRSFWAMLQQLVGMEQERRYMSGHFLHLEIGQLTDIGRKRKTNEDNLNSVIPRDPQIMATKGALFVVADGMGGHAKGEVASQLVVETVCETYYRSQDQDIATALRSAVNYANSTVYWQDQKDGVRDVSGMGSTCIAAVVLGESVYIANVGDSRAYIVRNGEARQITLDHSWVEELVRAGQITAEQARTHERRNVITRSIGTQEEVEVDIFTEPVQDGDVLVLCTDGLSSLVEDNEISAIVEQYGPQESVSHLIECANERGGNDNVTAIVARVAQAA
jgi:serine/threonine protein phosphatase PrpC